MLKTATSVSCKIRALFSVMSCGFLASSLQAATPAPGQTTDLFLGCDDAQVLTRPQSSPREKIYAAARKVDPVSKRVFQSYSMAEANGVDVPEYRDLCWSRLDGVWREQLRVSFDHAVVPNGWTGETPSMREFAHGTYTSPSYLVVEPASSYTEGIRLKDGLDARDVIEYRSSDGIAVADVLAGKATRKLYRGRDSDGRATELAIDVTRSGYVRLHWDSRVFLRPRPGISKAAREQQVATTDLFAIAYNPKNTRAIRQGYDVTTQNPNRFLDNGGKLDVFSPAEPRDYYVREQNTVPLGLLLIEEGSQGTVFFERLQASESDFQESSESSFGFNVGLGTPKARGENDAEGKRLGASAGYSFSKQSFSSLKESDSISSITGYQRFKKFALVRDHAFSRLSSEFIDAVADATRTGSFQRVIETFGTHYSYAATYGAAGQLTTRVTERTLAQTWGSFEKDDKSGGLKLGPLDFSGNITSAENLRQGNSNTNRFGKTTFSAVGGNGSWNESGFVAGDTPYPILMDMRPLYELLSPMHFPGEPEIYLGARAQLTQAITDYMAARAALLSRDSLIQDFRPPQPAARAERKLVKRLIYKGGQVSYFRTTNLTSVRQGHTRICLENNTGQPKELRWTKRRPSSIRHLKTPKNGAKSCANVPANQRVTFGFYDRGSLMKSSAMNINSTDGMLIEFIWVRDY